MTLLSAHIRPSTPFLTASLRRRVWAQWCVSRPQHVRGAMSHPHTHTHTRTVPQLMPFHRQTEECELNSDRVRRHLLVDTKR